jgi:hypothetical protein
VIDEFVSAVFQVLEQRVPQGDRAVVKADTDFHDL